MSYDIFNNSTSWSARFVEYTWLAVLVCIIAIVVGIFSTASYMKIEVEEDTSPKFKIKVILLGSGLTVVSALLGIYTMLIFTAGNVPDTTEVKRAIQEEYGFQLTDDSIQSLYDNYGSNGESFYAVDTAGKPHQYVVTGSEFHFLTKE